MVRKHRVKFTIVFKGIFKLWQRPVFDFMCFEFTRTNTLLVVYLVRKWTGIYLDSQALSFGDVCARMCTHVPQDRISPVLASNISPLPSVSKKTPCFPKSMRYFPFFARQSMKHDCHSGQWI